MGGRVVAGHFFSFVSAAVLLGFLAVVLTNQSFRDATRDSSAKADVAAVPDENAVATAVPPAARSAPPSAVPPERWVVYYLVASVVQQERLQEAIRNDAPYRGEYGVTTVVESVHFLLIRDHVEEGYAARLINVIAESAPRDGYNLKVIDLREPARLTAMEH